MDSSEELKEYVPHTELNAESVLQFPPDYYVILDFEATCDDKNPPLPQEIIEFPSVIIDAESLQEVSRFQQYVIPEHNPVMTNYCVKLTGITTQRLRAKGVGIHKALKNYNKWLAASGLIGKNFIIITCGDWDLGIMFPNQCETSNIKAPSHLRRWLDIKDCFRQHYGKRKAGSLNKMLDHSGLGFEGRPHSGIDDCHNTARLWVQMLNEGYLPKISDVNVLN
jgi:inhibitor of KinA sporulation pathway (predicted exonuclease)